MRTYSGRGSDGLGLQVGQKGSLVLLGDGGDDVDELGLVLSLVLPRVSLLQAIKVDVLARVVSLNQLGHDLAADLDHDLGLKVRQ